MKEQRMLAGMLGALLSFCLISGEAAFAGQEPDRVFSEQTDGVYALESPLPTFSRHRPLSEDDPAGHSDPKHSYRRGVVYSETGEACFSEGVLIGGNAASGCGGGPLDEDTNDFALVLPEASLFIDTDKLTFNAGSIEYTFHTEDFHYNDYRLYEHENVIVRGAESETTWWQMLNPETATYGIDGEPYLSRCCGVVYTGGIAKTQRKEDGSFTETVVQNPNAEEGLFSVRFLDAVLDNQGSRYNLVLCFDRITFVSEADLEGPLLIMEGDRLLLAPILFDGGAYLMNAAECRDGARIGASFEFSYRIETESGELTDGRILFSLGDLDEPSMASLLETDAAWETTPGERDARWAESIGIVSGALSPAIIPYYNHAIHATRGELIPDGNGEGTLVHVSRMKGTKESGTANGLVFSASAAADAQKSERDDANSYDTGFAVLMQPEGRLTASMSCDRRGYVERALFTSALAVRITQRATEGGSVQIIAGAPGEADASLQREDYLRVLAVGADSEHRIIPNRGYGIKSISIDNVMIPFADLNWEGQGDGLAISRYTITERYDALRTETEYRFVKEQDGSIRFRFENVEESHSLFVEFDKPIRILLARFHLRKKYWSFAAAFLSGLICLMAVFHLKKSNSYSDT